MDYANARHNMMEGQIRPNKVTDTLVIEALASIPRELFVPKASRGVAYVDEDLSLGQGRFLMEPVTFARMLQAADIEEGDVVLDIGCATGYSSAVLSRLATTVVAVEPLADMAAAANQTLGELGIVNVAVVDGQLTVGCPSQGPFGVIFLNGAVESVPDALLDQLADGGRLLAVVRPAGAPVGTATLFTRAAGHVGSRPLFDAGVPAWPEFAAPPRFVF